MITVLSVVCGFSAGITLFGLAIMFCLFLWDYYL